MKSLITVLAILALSAPAYAGMHHGGPHGGGMHPDHHYLGGPEHHFEHHLGGEHWDGEHHHFGPYEHGFHGGHGWGWNEGRWWWHGHRFVPGTYGGRYFAEPSSCLVWSNEYNTWVILPDCDSD